MTSPIFQAAIESLDNFTADFEYPVNETTGFRGKMKVVSKDDEEEEEEEDAMDGWQFDWKGMEQILTEIQE